MDRSATIFRRLCQGKVGRVILSRSQGTMNSHFRQQLRYPGTVLSLWLISHSRPSQRTNHAIVDAIEIAAVTSPAPQRGENVADPLEIDR